MAKALKTAALVVGAVALVATGIGAAAGVGIGLGLTAGTLGTIASVAAIAGVASGVLSVAAGLTAKKPVAQATGSQTQFAADPDAGIPLAIGRTGTAGNIVARLGWDTRDAGDNDRQTFVSVLSLGPVKEIEPALGVDRVPVYFDGQGRAIGGFAGFMWRTTQVGLLASAALTFGAGAGSPPVWGAQHGLSGKAATTWTLRFDTKSKLYQNGVPAPMNVVKGAFCYDPRKDSTYPGGSGPHRMADPADRAAYDAAVATWEFSECPFLNGLRFVHGYWQRDMANPASNWQRVMGMGAPLAGIDLASFVEGANVADANGWKAGGVIYSGDDKWASLKVILQAGMGEPLALGAKISCLVNAPKVSLATITEDDVVGECSVGATQPRRDRVNTITPKFRLEENGWQLLPGAPISVAEHVVADRGKRSRAQEYRMIQSASQAGTAVRYDIENAREFGPIVLPCKLFWMGYKPGDCVTANLPEVGLNGQPILLLNRGLAASSGIVTLTARSETPGKHAFALGQTATPPPTPGVTGATIVPVPTIDAWVVTGGSIAADGVTLASLTITGAVTASAIDGVIFDYRPFVSGQADEAGWLAAGTEAVDVTRKVITGVRDLAPYEVSVRYSARGFTSGRCLIGPVTTGAATVSWGDGVVGNGKPADDATNSRDPASPFGPDGTVGGTIDRLTDFDRAIAAAKVRTDTLVNETIPAVDRAVKDAGERITAARQDADKAVADANARIDAADRVIDGAVRNFAAEVDRAQGADEALSRRIDSIVAEGGYDDTDVRALISSEATVRADDDRALGRRVDTVSASVKEGDDAVLAGVKVTTDALARADAAFAEQARVIEASLGTVDNRIAAKAQEVTTAYTDADRALGTRSTVLEAAASYATSSAVRNENFNFWPDGQAHPSGWIPWVAQGNYRTERLSPGRAGGQYCVRTLNDVANVDSGFYQAIFTGGPGKWVVEVTVDCVAGGLSGAGVTLHGVWNLDFCGDPDTSGRVGDSSHGEVRSWSKMFDLDGRDLINVHAMVGWSGFGRTITPKYSTWHCLRVRPATDGEIKAGKADAALNNPGGVLARISASETTLADLPNRYAAASRADALEAQVNGATDSGLLRTVTARIEDRATAIADAKAGAVAEQVRLLTVGGGTIDQRITASANEVTRGYTDANRALGTRSTALEAAASSVTSSTVFNDNFNFWPDGATLPSRWFLWQTGGNFRTNRLAPGRGGGQFCVQTLNDVAEVDSGFVQTIYTAGAGKWVIEVTADFDGSGARGAGVSLSGVWNLDFCSEPDVNGVVGDRANTVRSWSKMVDLDGRDQINVHAMHGWTAFGRGVAAKYMVWHRLSLRPATDGEIKAGKADAALNNPGGVIARIGANEAVLADLPNRYATAQRASNIEASVGTVGGRVTAVETVTSNGTFATSSRAEQIASYAGGIESKVDLQAGTIAGLGQKTAAYVRVVADAGNGRAALSLWSDQYGGAWSLTGDGLIDGNLTVTGTITTRALADNSTKAGASIVGGDRAFTTASTTIAQLNFNVSSSASDIIITAAGAVLISPGAPAGTRATLIVSINGNIVVNEQVGFRGNLSNFNYPIPTGGFQGVCDFRMTLQASAGNGLDDPHIVNRPTLIVQEFKK